MINKISKSLTLLLFFSVSSFNNALANSQGEGYQKKSLAEKYGVKKSKTRPSGHVGHNTFYFFLNAEELELTRDSNNFAALSILISSSPNVAGWLRLNSDGYDSERIHAAAKTKANLLIGNSGGIETKNSRDEFGRRKVSYFDKKEKKYMSLPLHILQFAVYESAAPDSWDIIRKVVNGQEVFPENIDRQYFHYLSDTAYEIHFNQELEAKRKKELEELERRAQEQHQLASLQKTTTKKTAKTKRTTKLTQKVEEPKKKGNTVGKLALFIIGSSATVIGSLAVIDHFNIPSRVLQAGSPILEAVGDLKKAAEERLQPQLEKWFDNKEHNNPLETSESIDLNSNNSQVQLPRVIR